MRKIIALLVLLLFSTSFSLNVSANRQPGEIIFLVDGNHYEKLNLTFLIFVDGKQVNDVEKNEVMLPQLYSVRHNGTGAYGLRVVDSNGGSASAEVNLTQESQAQQPEVPAEQQKKEDEQSTLYAIIAALAGIIVLALILLRFLKSNSDNK
ncbi:MAG: hypothetical protein WC488_02070 [Candidatus Micrarchaeia archaeon]